MARARAANLRIKIIDRAHCDAGVEHLYKHGASPIIMGRREIAVANAGKDPAVVGFFALGWLSHPCCKGGYLVASNGKPLVP